MLENTNNKSNVNTLVVPFDFTIKETLVRQGTFIVEEDGNTYLLTEEEFNSKYNVDFSKDFASDATDDLQQLFDKLSTYDRSEDEGYSEEGIIDETLNNISRQTTYGQA